MRVTAVVLAAGSSRRLGRPKQLLPYRDATLLDATLARTRSLGLDQVVVALGGAAEQVRREVDLSGTDVVVNPEHATGCSSSVAAALELVDSTADGLVLLLGDQPEVPIDAVHRLLLAAADAPVGLVRYGDGDGHPFWFRRDMFDALRGLHGDKAVWKLLDAHADEAVRVTVPGAVPLDVDTWDDYQALLASTGAVR